jgi:DNA-binding transcriptional MocR family regulator
VFTESPSYDRTIGLLRRHGAHVVGIAMEPDGPNIGALESALKKGVPKFFYTIPDFQNPTGATCSGTKRRQIVEVAAKYGLLLVEDAPYRQLRYRGKEEPTLYEVAPDRTLHMSSFTKLIAPGVRTGFMIGEPSIIGKLAKVAEDTYISPGYLAQAITWEWCRRGLLPAQIERLKKLSTTAVRTRAAAKALNLADGLAFFPERGGERFLRLPFCALSPAEIDDGVKRLSEAVSEISG